jgi:predicted DNA-binding helix-hairpin-helix protein
MGLIGSIINMLVHMDIVQKALPQSMDETMTITIAFKRRLKYKNAYQIERVHVNIVPGALKELCLRTLYKDQNISINKVWVVVLQQDNKKCMEDTNYGCESDIET